MVAFTRGAHMHTECTICGDIRMVIQDGLKLESEEKTNLCCVFFLFFSSSSSRIQAFNPDNEYHFKNRMKACQRNWAEVFGDEGNMFAVSPSNSYQKVRAHATFRPRTKQVGLVRARRRLVHGL